MSHPLEHLMEAMAGRERGHDSDDEVGLTDLQMVNRLRTFSEQCYEQEPVKFKTGDIIVHKVPEMSATRWARRPAVFVRYLNKPYLPIDHADGSDAISKNSMGRAYDCVVAYLVRVGQRDNVAEFLESSAQFRLYHEEK